MSKKTQERIELERLADYHGIPYVNETTSLELANAIAAKATNASVADAAPKPDCYGKVWEAITDATCQGCAIKDQCLTVFAYETMDQARDTLGKFGDPFTLKDIARVIAVEPENVEFAESYREQLEKKKEAELCPGEPKKIKKQPVTAEVARQTQTAPSPKPSPEKPQLEPKPKAKAKTTKPSKPKKATKPKAEKPLPTPEVVQKPQAQAQPKLVQSAKARGTKKVTVKGGRSAPHVGDVDPRDLTPEQFQNKAQWELIRAPWVEDLEPGTVIQASYKNQPITVVRQKVGWTYNGELYPSLSEVAGAISGWKTLKLSPTKTRKVPRMTAKDLFALHQIVDQLKHGLA